MKTKTDTRLWLLIAALLLVFVSGSPATAMPPVTLIDPPWQESQIDGRFPDTSPTTRVYAQNRRLFKAYQGQGSLTVENHGVISAEVYVNGRRISMDAALRFPNSRTTIDLGPYTVNGDNTLKVLHITPPGSQLILNIPYPELTVGEPAAVGFSSAKLAQIDTLIRSEVARGFPGAVLLVLKDGRIVKNTAYGWQKKYNGDQLLAPGEPMTPGTMFDLASNTKVYATVMALMKLVDEGRVDPDARVSAYLPDFHDAGREEITVRDLLTHSAGLAPEIKYFDPAEAGAFYSVDRTTTLSLTQQAPLLRAPGTATVYSDTGFILLGDLVEHVTGQRLDDYLEQQLYRPLGLAHTLFNPLRKGFAPAQFAATERNGNTRDHQRDFPGIRQTTIQGEVHDEKAFYSLDGVAGHAGLFSRSQDLAVLAQLLLNGGGYGGYRLCSPAVVTAFTKPSVRDPRFGLGWNKGGHPGNIYEFGPYASDQVIGHTGWVGIDTCIDFKQDMAIILLTNKVHSPMMPGQINRFATADLETGKYGSIISLVYEALLEKDPR
ncbi:MAG TPA: penicillin binding protein PBP4B [Patescibacteria group bacterium]|nr:penicillin binding protein PBP4B [Patescibacteria group bacterium]